ncbi:MAG: restriction endonuclease [Christensenellaceae bacterium]|nr:restriction endonuclease [Christensenellaceae bacterium]
MLNDVLDKVRAECTDEAGNEDKKKLGTTFENMVVRYLTTDPIQKQGITKLYLWSTFPHRYALTRGQDTGIYIVAETENEREYIAIQCKCYAKDSTVVLDDLGNFFNLSGKKFFINNIECKFTRRIFVATTNKWTKHAEDSFNNQDPPASRITLKNLEESGVDWEKIYEGLSGERARSKIHKLFDYQEAALKAVCEHLKDHDRCKLIMSLVKINNLLKKHPRLTRTANSKFFIFSN